MKKPITLIGIVTLAIGLGHGGLVHGQTRELGSSGELLDGIAAIVDTGVVLKSELARRVEAATQNFIAMNMSLPPERRSSLPPMSVVEQQALDQLIIEEIQLQRARRAGMIVGDDLLNQVLAETARRAGISLEQLPAALASEGLDYIQFREDQRRSVMIEQLIRNDVARRIAISPRELEQCLARRQASETDQFEYNVSHILIGFSQDASSEELQEAETLARDIVRQLDQGGDFAQLAVTYSDAPTALQGGQLDWRMGAELPTIFAADVTEMDVGEHSTPIRASGGFHIVKLNEMRGAEPELVDQVHARHILLSTNEVLDDDATMQKLSGLRDLILSGEDFATVAKAQSQDTTSAINGGDLGWAQLTDYDPVFAAVLATAEIGELSEPFRSDFGWHIAEVLGRRQHDISGELDEQDCRNQIGTARLDEERELWEQRLRDEAYIVKRL